MKYSIILSVVILLLSGVQPTNAQSSFSFAFLTDVHLNKDNHGNCVEGLKKALNKTQELNADFVLFGGDNMDIDGLWGNEKTADSLMYAFQDVLKESGVTYYPCIGNHDRFNGYKTTDSVNSSRMFEQHFGRSYYNFNYNGIEFIVLNSVIPGDKNSYYIYDEQKKWLQNTLKRTDSLTPIIVTLHVPMMSLYYQTVEGRVSGDDVMSNFKEIWEMFDHHNLALVLQGHQHLYEQMYARGTWFVTGGAVSAAWWSSPYYGTQEGFLLVTVDREKKISWEYIDYGWDVKK